MPDTVLVIESSLTVRMEVVRALQRAGLEAVPCAGTVEAAQALADHQVDGVILDADHPDGGPLEFLAQLRASPRCSDAAVLLVSTDPERARRSAATRGGADDYLAKPYDLAKLTAATRRLLEARRSSSATPTTVLLIEDDVVVLDEVTRTLETEGYVVLSAGHSGEELHAAAVQQPDVVVVDGALPQVDGPGVIRRLQLDPALREVPCVLLTASQDPVVEVRARAAGADAVVPKEVGPDGILHLAEVVREVSETPRADGEAAAGAPKRVLAVDDSRTYLEAIGASLRGEGYDVILVRSGEAACEMLADQPVDCILLDLKMPGLSGQDTCRRIKSAATLQAIPIIMLTGAEDARATVECLAAGADDFIHKSSDLEILKARVRAQIRRKRFEDENRRFREELVRAEIDAAQARAASELAEVRGSLITELQWKNQELQAFSSSVSHDLRNPLQALLGFGQLLEEDYADQLDEMGAYFVQQICRAGRRMAQIIDDLMQLSHVNGVELRLEEVDISSIARETLDELRGRDPKRQVVIEVTDGALVRADGRLMRVLMDNLLGNAWKYSSKTTPSRIQFGWSESGGVCTCFVRDNGAGFDMDEADGLFTPFRRLHDAADFPGTGIGLTTVHRVMDRHGGRVWAEGAVGRGATFSFELPSVAAGGDSADRDADSASTEQDTGVAGTGAVSSDGASTETGTPEGAGAGRR